MDAAARIDNGYSGVKYSSAYSPPELIHFDQNEGIAQIKTFKINPKTKDIANRELLSYDLIKANISHDSWSFGVVLFELFTGKKLLFAGT